MASLALRFSLSGSPKIELRPGSSIACNSSTRTQVISQMRKDNVGRQIWRRRKLTRIDRKLEQKRDYRVPFLEEQVRKIQEKGKVLTMDIETLMMREENRFDFVNEIAAEATEYIIKDRDAYGGTKKAILHVISNRMNEAGYHRADAYAEVDEYKPGPHFLKEEYT